MSQKRKTARARASSERPEEAASRASTYEGESAIGRRMEADTTHGDVFAPVVSHAGASCADSN